MGENRWRTVIAPGNPLKVDGVDYLIQAVVDGWVTLAATSSGDIIRFQMREVVNRLTGSGAPPPLSARIHDVDERVTPAQKEKVDERLAIIRWYETGLRPEQSADEVPDPCFDPAIVPSAHARIREMARDLAARRNTRVESAARYINRTLAKASIGKIGLLDQRLVNPTRMRRHAGLDSLVTEFLLDRESRSTTTVRAQYMMFAARLKREGQNEPPPERAFADARRRTLARYPHLALSAKSRASVAKAPNVAIERRSASRVGEYWIIDSTKSNVMLRDPHAMSATQRTYRVTTTRVMDGASRYIVGRSTSVNVDGFAAGLALADAFRAMVDGRDSIASNAETRSFSSPVPPPVLSRWPVLPRRLLLDNGREFLNRHGLLTLHRLGIDVEPQRVEDGRAKGRIERFFGTNRSNFEELQHNYIGHSTSVRGQDSDSEVILTAPQLIARDAEWTDLYNSREHGGLFAETGRRISPAARWIELAEEHGIAEITTWHNEWIYFLPNQVLKLDRYGINRRGLTYNAPIIAALIDTDGAAPPGKVHIFCDPNDLRQVYCYDPDGNAYEIPWVHRIEETQPFSDLTLDVAKTSLAGTTRSQKEHEQRLIELLMRWQTEDIGLLIQIRRNKPEEEILTSQLNTLRAVDHGTVIEAGEFIDQATIDAMKAKLDALERDEDEGTELLGNDEDDLFYEFDS